LIPLFFRNKYGSINRRKKTGKVKNRQNDAIGFKVLRSLIILTQFREKKSNV